jgi:hypothetical protein
LNFHHLVETMSRHGWLLRKSLHVVETVKRVMLHFHCLVVPVGLDRLWIPAFAGMTMKAKAAGMSGSSENPLQPQGWTPQADRVGSIQGKLSPLENHPWSVSVSGGLTGHSLRRRGIIFIILLFQPG